VIRRIALIAALAGLLAAPARAQSTLMPGVTYDREVEFTPNGPIVLHVLTAPRPIGLWSLKPVLSNNAVVGKEKLTAIQRGISGSTTSAGVNGDFFRSNPGDPSGILIRSGVLDSPPLANRSAVGIGRDGMLTVDRVSLFGRWQGTGVRRALTINEPPGGGTTLYTTAWGPTTPAEAAPVVADVIPSFPPSVPNADVSGQVGSVATTGGLTIPPGGAVLVARGAEAPKLAAETRAGGSVTVRMQLAPVWGGVYDAIGGGPVLVRQGKLIFRPNESVSAAWLGTRNARTAVGQLADGRIVLIAADGGRRGYSVGMTNFELALALVRLGVVTGAAMDGGASTTMAFDGTLLNRPYPAETEISDALLVLYAGVVAAEPAQAVLSPNADGVADTQSLSYKLPRAASVRAVVRGPDGSERVLDAGQKAAGSYTLAWDGAGAPEGPWTFAVAATDDQGRPSSTDRQFSLNNTLGSLKVDQSVLTVFKARGSVLGVSFALARPATVTATVETRSGAVVQTLAKKKALGAGPQTLTWNGRDLAGRPAFGGRYVIRVAAVNELGSVDLTAPFTVRRA
jgi:hypothetical protein